MSSLSLRAHFKFSVTLLPGYLKANNIVNLFANYFLTAQLGLKPSCAVKNCLICGRTLILDQSDSNIVIHNIYILVYNVERFKNQITRRYPGTRRRQ